MQRSSRASQVGHLGPGDDEISTAALRILTQAIRLSKLQPALANNTAFRRTLFLASKLRVSLAPTVGLVPISNCVLVVCVQLLSRLQDSSEAYLISPEFGKCPQNSGLFTISTVEYL